mmetsp:Transcript_37181/g.91525  ORF Transcript_37181/g.91525 Transcript_37181/m.91525 type:complete len:340 (-) Transcript_37181:4-1023(-)
MTPFCSPASTGPRVAYTAARDPQARESPTRRHARPARETRRPNLGLSRAGRLLAGTYSDLLLIKNPLKLLSLGREKKDGEGLSSRGSPDSRSGAPSGEVGRLSSGSAPPGDATAPPSSSRSLCRLRPFTSNSRTPASLRHLRLQLASPATPESSRPKSKGWSPRKTTSRERRKFSNVSWLPQSRTSMSSELANFLAVEAWLATLGEDRVLKEVPWPFLLKKFSWGPLSGLSSVLSSSLRSTAVGVCGADCAPVLAPSALRSIIAAPFGRASVPPPGNSHAARGEPMRSPGLHFPAFPSVSCGRTISSQPPRLRPSTAVCGCVRHPLVPCPKGLTLGRSY